MLVAVVACAFFAAALVTRPPPAEAAAQGVPLTGTTSSSVHDATNTAVTAVAVGGIVHDSVTVDGGSGNPVPTGNVTIDWFTNGTCANAPASTSAPTDLTGGSLEATGFAQGPLAPGEYAFEAHYLGDTNYAPSDGPCEPLQVVDSYVTISPANPSNPAGSTQTLMVQVFTNDGSGSGYVGANEVTVALALVAGSPGSFSGVSQTACVTDATGTCTIATSDASVAEDFLQASVSVTVGGVTMARSTGTPAPGQANSGNAVENWFLPPTPGISIAVSPGAQTITSGAAATFTLVVTNSGAVPLTNVAVSDALSPSCNQPSAANPALASMAPGTSVTYSCSLANVTASFTNVATASGMPPSGPVVSATGSAPVTVLVPVTPPPPTGLGELHPMIGIQLDPASQEVAIGGSAKFKVTVANRGDVTLTDVTVRDRNARRCNRHFSSLAVGASTSYSCAKTTIHAALENVATATGRPPTGKPVEAKDSVEVRVRVTSGLLPPKTTNVDISIAPGEQALATQGTASFVVTVSNAGDVVLRHVRVVDPESPGCAQSFRFLGPGKKRQFTCQRQSIQHAFVNVATATGTSPQGVTVHNTFSVHVSVVLEISVTTPGSLKTLVPGRLTRFDVKINALQPLTDVKTSDPQAPNCNTFIGVLNPGSPWTFDCRVRVAKNLSNTVTVTGKTEVGHDPVAAATVLIKVKSAGHG